MGNIQTTTRMDVRKGLPFGVMALVLIAAPHPAGADMAVVGKPTPGACESALGPGAEERYARGEAFYDGEWMPVEKLFQEYCRQRDRLRDIREDGSRNKNQLSELHREKSQIREAEQKEAQSIRLRLGKIRHRLRECRYFLRQDPPAKPVLLHLPMPARSSSWRDREGISKNERACLQRQAESRARHDWTYRARQAWVQRSKEIEEQNEEKVKLYREKMKKYNKRLKEIKQEVPKLEAQAEALEKQLAEIEKKYNHKMARAIRRSEDVSDQVQVSHRRADLIEDTIEAIAEALSAVPEGVLYKHGIAEFEGEFRNVGDLQRQYKRKQRKIDHAHERLRVECEQIGVPVPEDWRHPQQNRMDKIKALVEEINQARAATG